MSLAIVSQLTFLSLTPLFVSLILPLCLHHLLLLDLFIVPLLIESIIAPVFCMALNLFGLSLTKLLFLLIFPFSSFIFFSLSFFC